MLDRRSYEAKSNDKSPSLYESKWRTSALEAVIREGIIDANELSLFRWYADEHGKFIDQMLAIERAYIQEQEGTNIEDINDSGLQAVEYYIKRARYADVIYMTSLLESYLTGACKILASVLDDQIIIFRFDELSGNGWSKRKKFLERYGRLAFPVDAWAELKILICVRNNIVHENGNPESFSQNNKKEIQKRPGIKTDESELVIESAFVMHCLSAFQTLVDHVDEQINQAVKQRQAC